jgi:hypothetical protein
MTVGTNQNIGIGGAVTSDTTYKWLTITGPTTSGGGILQLNNSDSSVGINMFCNNLAGYVGTSTAHSLLFRTNSSEAARIDPSGNLLVGGTSSTARLAVSGPASASYPSGVAFIVSNTGGDTAYPAAKFQKVDASQTTSQVFLQFVSNSGLNGCGQINANGVASAAFGTYSDQRLKENITSLPSQLGSICALRPVEFDYIESEGGGHQIGFIAQEMQTIYPDTVGERSDGMLTVTGWSKTDARLVAAIKELSAKNDALEARLSALEAK